MVLQRLHEALAKDAAATRLAIDGANAIRDHQYP
jgi:hypothetical protein